MLKALTILAVALAIAQTPAPAQRETANPKASAGQTEKGNTDGGQKPTDTTAATVGPKQGKSPALNSNPQKEGSKDGWDKAGVLANYLLVVIGIGGIVAAVFTLCKLERQTKSTEDAAKAALLNAQALINAERAWIVIEVERDGPNAL